MLVYPDNSIRLANAKTFPPPTNGTSKPKAQKKRNPPHHYLSVKISLLIYRPIDCLNVRHARKSKYFNFTNIIIYYNVIRLRDIYIELSWWDLLLIVAKTKWKKTHTEKKTILDYQIHRRNAIRFLSDMVLWLVILVWSSYCYETMAGWFALFVRFTQNAAGHRSAYVRKVFGTKHIVVKPTKKNMLLKITTFKRALKLQPEKKTIYTENSKI